jgi:NAD(P)-dependent dehydrogenase (short-subunit alcohol dehydrogenase family)
MTVVLTGSDRPRGETIARETGASFLECDHRDRASTDRVVEQALALTGGRLDVLVTNSERKFEGSLEATSDNEFRDLVEVNLTYVFRISRACWEAMRRGGGGSMVHVTSDGGIRAAHETAAYSVTSAGVMAVADLLAAEGAPSGIRVNAVCPGGPVTATDVASAVAWLASDDSAHVNGASVRLDAAAGAAMVVDTRT